MQATIHSRYYLKTLNEVHVWGHLNGLPRSRAERDECGRAGWNRTIFKGFGDPYSTGKLRPFTMFRAYFGPHFVMTKLRPYVVGTQAMLTALQSMFELNYILKLASSKPNLLR